MLITFEGGEGSGKTTQARLLLEHLQAVGCRALLTREPGGTPLAEQVRSLLLGGDGVSDPLTEFLLITAARRDHVETLIKPKLADGFIVICDRFFDSTLVYQGYVKGLSIPLMESIHAKVFGSFAPDITFVIDLPPEEGLKRIHGSRSNAARERNHYDNMELEFHKKIRDGFLKIGAANSERVQVIDGGGSMGSINGQIVSHVLSAMPK